MTDDPTSDDLTSNDRLGEILHSAVPDGPDPVDRAAAVVRRGRSANRRRGAGGVLAVGVVALAVVVGPNLLDTGAAPSNQAGPGTTTLPGPGQGTPAGVAGLDHPYTCPKAGEPDRRASVPPTDSIPAGAVLARICARSGEDVSAWAPPLDALVTHVDLVGQAYNDLPKGQPLPCPGFPGPRPSFSVTFQYPDGHLVRVSATSIGTGVCNFISIDGRDELGRSSSETVMQTYLRELQRQRASEDSSEPLTPTPMTCPNASSANSLPETLFARVPMQFQRILVCFYTGSGLGLHQTPSQLIERTIVGPSLAGINADLAKNGHWDARKPYGACEELRGPTSCSHLELYGIDQWGDVVHLSERRNTVCADIRCRPAPTVYVWANHRFVWEPTPATIHLIHSAIGH